MAAHECREMTCSYFAAQSYPVGTVSCLFPEGGEKIIPAAGFEFVPPVRLHRLLEMFSH